VTYGEEGWWKVGCGVVVKRTLHLFIVNGQICEWVERQEDVADVCLRWVAGEVVSQQFEEQVIRSLRWHAGRIGDGASDVRRYCALRSAHSAA
jgi:hypothetical protein